MAEEILDLTTVTERPKVRTARARLVRAWGEQVAAEQNEGGEQS